jgi:hypothetical protein
VSAELAVALDYARIGFVDFDELFEVLDAEAVKRDRAAVVDGMDGQASVFGVSLSRRSNARAIAKQIVQSMNDACIDLGTYVTHGH